MAFIIWYLVIGLAIVASIILFDIDAFIDTISEDISDISFWAIVGIVSAVIIAATVWPYWVYICIRAIFES